MPLQIIRQDITKMDCDAIVNSTNSALIGSGGMDAVIHREGGRKLDGACEKIGYCPVGEARLTKGYDLPCRFVIHTVGPLWEGGDRGEGELLRKCYGNSLALARKSLCKSVAVPLIGVNVLGIPRKVALQTAISAIGDFLLENEMQVYLVVYGKEDFGLSERLFPDVQSYIDDNYVSEHYDAAGMSNRRRIAHHFFSSSDAMASLSMAPTPMESAKASAKSDANLAGAKQYIDSLLDESFSEMVLRKIDERGWKDSECYKRANLDRKLFSKLRSNVNYRPSKPTALALAIALELPLSEAKDMLTKAGYALSHSNKADLIVEFYIKSGNYNIFEINEALFAFDQALLGA